MSRILPYKLLRTVLIMALLFVSVSGRDDLKLNVAQTVSSSYLYNIFHWELMNFPSKWVHLVSNFGSNDRRSRPDIFDQYRSFQQELSQIEHEINIYNSKTTNNNTQETVNFQRRKEDILSRFEKINDDLEEILESAISLAIRQIGFASWGKLVFPPVDIRLREPPKLLVTSPRDHIYRQYDVLLDSEITLAERERIESRLHTDYNLSALVTNLGGVATYPAFVPNDLELFSTLKIAAHEWLHHHFFFRPVGQNINKSAEMRLLNETTANIFGKEIAILALNEIKRKFPEIENDYLRETTLSNATQYENSSFDFRKEMSLTRIHTERLLVAGEIEKAEGYMEERRKFFVENGFLIRKINQAYFAFHGSYGDSPSSISPIGDELHKLREYIPDLSEFIESIAKISSYAEFQYVLAQQSR